MTEVNCFICNKSFVKTSEHGEIMHFEGYSRIRGDYMYISLPMCAGCIKENE